MMSYTVPLRDVYATQYSLRERYVHLLEALAEHDCESCGGPAQHVDADGGLFCLECSNGEDFDEGDDEC